MRSDSSQAPFKFTIAVLTDVADALAAAASCNVVPLSVMPLVIVLDGADPSVGGTPPQAWLGGLDDAIIADEGLTRVFANDGTARAYGAPYYTSPDLLMGLRQTGMAICRCGASRYGLDGAIFPLLLFVADRGRSTVLDYSKQLPFQLAVLGVMMASGGHPCGDSYPMMLPHPYRPDDMPTLPPSYPDVFRRLMLTCSAFDPTLRPSIAVVVQQLRHMRDAAWISFDTAYDLLVRS
jgi:hypothetical protein